ncbi:MAG: anaerobic ribonucleoside triphosphate reductase [Thermofilaceae archaeon]
MSLSEALVKNRADILRELEEAYLRRADWEVRENANTNFSYSNFRNYLFEKLVKSGNVIASYLPPESVGMHFNGDIHIHKLPDSLWIPYCTGWSYRKVLESGLRTPGIVSSPAKHFDTAVSHLVNFFFMGAQEFTGAQATSAFDLYTAPFISNDNLERARIKQALQSMLFELNYPARAGYQSPFTNITLVLDTSPGFLEGPAIVNGKRCGLLGEFVSEAITVARCLFELYLEGDAIGQPFTFPIPTLMLTKSFDWSGGRWGELTDLIFETLARRGSAYLLNGYASNVEALYAMCCRLTIDVNHALNNGGGLKLSYADAEDVYESFLKAREGGKAYGTWALPDATGSIGVVTVNLPRIAALSKGEWSVFEELLQERLKNAREVLKTWRERYERSLKVGLMPVSKAYLGHFNHHFATFGLIGMPEAAANFVRDPSAWFNGDLQGLVDIERRMVELIRKYALECEGVDGCLYNVEEVPGESTGYRLAVLDRELFKGRSDVLIPGGDSPFYSNSIVPYYAPVSLYERAALEGRVQGEFTGGVMMHLFLEEQPDVEALKKLVRRIIENTGIVYFSITPTISVCRWCGWSSVGTHWQCLKCEREAEVWSRIVGYYRPVKQWNPGKKTEFRLRKHYTATEIEGY